ncbi:hypothetical protein D3C79_874310 [compost metagenome]
MLGAGDVVAVVQVDLAHFQLVVEQVGIVVAFDAVAQHGAQLILGRTTRATGIGGGTLGFRFVGQDQLVWRASVNVDAAACQGLAQLGHGFAIGVACTQVQFRDGQLTGAGTAQLETAGTEHHGQAHYQQIAFDHLVAPLWADSVYRPAMLAGR